MCGLSLVAFGKLSLLVCFGGSFVEWVFQTALKRVGAWRKNMDGEIMHVLFHCAGVAIYAGTTCVQFLNHAFESRRA